MARTPGVGKLKFGKSQMSKKFSLGKLAPLFLAILALAVLFLAFSGAILSYGKSQAIVIGTANPGTIQIFRYGSGGVSTEEIETGKSLVHTVRVGDPKNTGKNVLVAGESNGFSGPQGCRVSLYEKVDGKWERETVDEPMDLRCKDLAIGDADNDGRNEIVLGTHGSGLVVLYKWDGSSFEPTILDMNVVAAFDKEGNETHLAKTNFVGPVNTAIHIVKIGDLDNDGRNEVVATASSPLEFLADEVTFIRKYSVDGKGKWSASTIDFMRGREFRSQLIADVDYSGENSLVVGIGTPGKSPGSVFSYKALQNGSYSRQVLHDDSSERNMKGLAFGDLLTKGKPSLVVATGLPEGKVLVLSSAPPKELANAARILNGEAGSEFNSLGISLLDLNSDGRTDFSFCGIETEPAKGIGWEASAKGFLIGGLSNGDGSFTTEVLSRRNCLAIDAGLLPR